MPHVESAVRSKQAVAAARAVLMRDGVVGTTMRAVAAEAGIPLGTLQYVFPTKQGLLKAVIEDIVAEIAEVLSSSAELDSGLEHSIRVGLRNFWDTLVIDHFDLQLVQYELVSHALRTPELAHLPKWQYEMYAEGVAAWCQEAATRAGETTTIPFDRLARVLVGGIDGLILQHVINPDIERSNADLETLIEMVVGLAVAATAGVSPRAR